MNVRTNTQNTLITIMIGILLACGYIILLRTVLRKGANIYYMPFVILLTGMVYLFVLAPVILLIQKIGSKQTSLIGLVMFFSVVALVIFIVTIVRNFHEVHKGMLMLFVVYIFAIGYMTIFSRDGTNDTSMLLFDINKIRTELRNGSYETLNHMFLNIVMFVPAGLFLPFIYPKDFNKFSVALVMGILVTTFIEVTQMALRLGQTDLGDIITNVLGAVIGLWIYRLYLSYSRSIVYKE